MRLPRWDELDQGQRDVLDTPVDSPLFAVGPPGSGKTVLAVRRAGRISEDGRQVVIVTYNRMLRRHLRLLNGEDIGIFTMHSFIGRDFRKRGGECSIGDDHEFDWQALLTHLDQDRTEVAPVDLVVDEGQDLPQGFYRYVSRGVAQTLSVFADQAQALRTHSTSIEQIREATGLDAPTILQNNHRNTRQIARLAEHFHSGALPAATVKRTADGDRPRLVRAPKLETATELIATSFRNRGGSVGVIVERIDTGRKVQEDLRVRLPGVRVDRYDSESQNEDSILLTEPGITVLTKKSVKGQEFEAVFVLELERHLFATKADLRAMYMMCSRARDMLTLVYGPSPLTSAATSLLPDAEVLEPS